MPLSHRTRSLGEGRGEQAGRGVASLRAGAIARVNGCIMCCRAPRCVRCVGPLTTRQRCNWATQRRRGDSATPDSGQAGALRHALLSDAQPAKIDAASGIRNRSTQQQAGKQLSNINIATNTNTNTQHSTAQHSKSKHPTALRNRTPAARHSPAVRADRYRMSPLSRHFHWQRLLGGSCARGWVLDSAPSLRVVPQQGRRHPCRLLVPAISGCCSLPLRLRRPRGGMCARNRPGVMPTAQCRLLHR